MQQYYVLLSGGLDSTLAALLTLSNNGPIKLTPLFFRYGQNAESEESNAVHELIPRIRKHPISTGSLIDDCRELNVNGLYSHGVFSWSKSTLLQSNPNSPGSPDVENRNMILIGYAASIIMADWKERQENPTKLVVGFKNEGYDTNKSFINAINNVFRASKRQIYIDAPLIVKGQKGKSSPRRLAKLAFPLNTTELLEQTWSCYYPEGGRPCITEKCFPCRGRERFFKELQNYARYHPTAQPEIES